MMRVPNWYEDKDSPAYYTARAFFWRCFWKLPWAIVVLAVTVITVIALTHS
jgi:hypothetical protein